MSYVKHSSFGVELVKQADAGNARSTLGLGALAVENSLAVTDLENISTSSIVGRATAGSGAPEVLSAAQVRTIINVEDGAEVNTVDSVNSQTGAVVLDADDIDDTSTTNKFATAAQLAKINYLTVTANTDLDAIRTAVNNLDSAIIFKGEWDASSGSFPGSGSAQAGWQYIVSGDGTVDSREFKIGDALFAIVDNASTTTYASNWLHVDNTDKVASVNGQTGIVSLDQDDIADGTTYKQYSSTEKTKLAGIEAGADVTDATNVAAAGAVMDTDTDASGYGFVIDEDDMSSDSATKLPTQQSVKAYVDASVSSFTRTVEAKSATFTAVANYIYKVDMSGGDVTVNLPAASTWTGKIITVKRIGNSNTLTIDANSTETIDGAATVAIYGDQSAQNFVSDGTNIIII